MGLFNTVVKDRAAQRAAAENATYVQAEIAQMQNFISDQQKVIDSLLDGGKNEEAIPYINDASATEKEIEAKQHELRLCQRGLKGVKPAQKADRIRQNYKTLGNYYNQQAKGAEGPESRELTEYAQELDNYTGQTNVNYVVDSQVNAGKNQLTPEGNAYLARIQARREQRKAEAGGLEAQLEAAKAKT